MFDLKLPRNFASLANIESVYLWHFKTQPFHIIKRYLQPLIFDNQQQVHPRSFCYEIKQPLKDGALSGFGQSVLRRS